MKKPLDIWLERYYGQPPTEGQTEEAMRNLMGFVKALIKAEAEMNVVEAGKQQSTSSPVAAVVTDESHS